MTEAPDTSRDEIAEKVPYWTSEVVNLRLAEAFPGEGRATAAVLLAALVGEDPADPQGSDEASCRLMLDALKVSEGNLTKLRLWVEVAQNDPRDLIAAAEYPGELGEQGDQVRRTDLDGYLAWLQGRT